MRPALGELLLAQVQADVGARRGGQPAACRERDVGVDGPEQLAEYHLRLVAQRAAGEESAYHRAGIGQPADGLPGRGGQARGQVRDVPAELGGYPPGALLQTPGKHGAGQAAVGRVHPDAGGYQRLAPAVRHPLARG